MNVWPKELEGKQRGAMGDYEQSKAVGSHITLFECSLTQQKEELKCTESSNSGSEKAFGSLGVFLNVAWMGQAAVPIAFNKQC